MYQIRLINEIKPEGGKMMRIGMWGYKDKGWKLYPVYHLYRLFTRYIMPGSSVLEVKVSPQETLKGACIRYGNNYSLFIVNLTDKEHVFRADGMSPAADLKKHVYSMGGLPMGENMLSCITIRVGQDGYLRGKIPPKSVILYTDLEG
jgi:hypothetical protein